MTSRRTRTNQRLAKRQAQKKIQGNTDTMIQQRKRRKSTTRQTKQNTAVAINLDMAKRIVQEACIAAMDSAGKDADAKPTPLVNPLTENEDSKNSSQREKDTEAIFADFVSATIARTIASIRPETKTRTSKPKKRKQSRKRKRPLPTKVRGVEHADSLYRMCSLFPTLVSQEEASGDERNTGSEMAAGDLDLTMNDKDHPNLSESSDTLNKIINRSAKHKDNVSSNNHTDHDSLLPPVGTTSASATPTKPSVATVSAKTIPISTAQQQQQEEEECYPLHRIESMMPPMAENPSFHALSSPSRSQRNAGKRNEKTDDDHDSRLQLQSSTHWGYGW